MAIIDTTMIATATNCDRVKNEADDPCWDGVPSTLSTVAFIGGIVEGATVGLRSSTTCKLLGGFESEIDGRNSSEAIGEGLLFRPISPSIVLTWEEGVSFQLEESSIVGKIHDETRHRSVHNIQNLLWKKSIIVQVQLTAGGMLILIVSTICAKAEAFSISSTWFFLYFSFSFSTAPLPFPLPLVLFFLEDFVDICAAALAEYLFFLEDFVDILDPAFPVRLVVLFEDFDDIFDPAFPVCLVFLEDFDDGCAPTPSSRGVCMSCEWDWAFFEVVISRFLLAVHFPTRWSSVSSARRTSMIDNVSLLILSSIGMKSREIGLLRRVNFPSTTGATWPSHAELKMIPNNAREWILDMRKKAVGSYGWDVLLQLNSFVNKLLQQRILSPIGVSMCKNTATTEGFFPIDRCNATSFLRQKNSSVSKAIIRRVSHRDFDWQYLWWKTRIGRTQ